MSATAPRSEALPMLWVSSFSPPDLFVAEALRFPALRSARALRRKPNTGTEGIEVSTWDMDGRTIDLTGLYSGQLSHQHNF